MAKKEKRDSSDPLPFIQVDRAAKQPAAMLAGQLGVTFQHALGGLIQFWEINGNRRELDKLIEANTFEVVLDAAEVERRFVLAMGKRAELRDLVDLHLLEEREGGKYRVRGMSRFFKPLVELRDLKARAVAGGKASAKARKDSTGTAQPRSGVRSASGSEPGSTVVREPVREPFDAGSASGSNHARTTPEAQPNTDDRRQTSEDRFQSSTTTGTFDGAVVVGKEFWDWCNKARLALHGIAAETEMPARWAEFWADFSHQRTRRAQSRIFELYLRDPHFEDRGWPMAVFIEPGVYAHRLRIVDAQEAAA